MVRDYKVVISNYNWREKEFFISRRSVIGLKRYISNNLISYACEIKIYGIHHTASGDHLELLFTRRIDSYDIEFGITSKTMPWTKAK